MKVYERLLILATAALLGVTSVSCGGAKEPAPRPRLHDESDEAHDELSSDGSHTMWPLISMGSPLIHADGGAAHSIVTIVLASEIEARSRASAPLASLRSPLVIAADAPHDHPPVLLISEGAKPTTAVSTMPTSVTVRAASPTISAAVDVSISGTLVRVDERSIGVQTDRGERSVGVPVSTRVLRDVDGSVSDIALGDTVGATKRPDGSVRSVQIHPRGLSTLERGIYPLTGADQGMLMLTGMVTGLSGGSIVVLADGQTFPLRLMGDTRVVKAQNAVLGDLEVGRLVSARAVQQPNGAATAVTVRVMNAFTPQTVPSAPRRASVAPSPSPLPH